MTPMGLIKNFTAAGIIAKRRIIAFAAGERRVVQATSGAGLLGVSGIRGAASAGERIDVYLTDIQPVEFGGVVAAGDWITADASGKGIKAAPASGVKIEVIGKAMEAGVDGSIGDVLIAPQQITG